MSPAELRAVAKSIEAAPAPDMALVADVYEALGYEVIRRRGPVCSSSHRPNGSNWKYRGESADVPVCGGNRWMAMQRLLFDLGAAKSLVPPGAGYAVGRGRTRPDEPLGGALIYSLDGEIVFAAGEHEREEHALVAAALRYFANLREAGGIVGRLIPGRTVAGHV